MKTVVTVQTLAPTIRGLSESFKAFHLAPCHCGLPVWQQPCPACCYYPMYGHPGTTVAKNAYATAEHLAKELNGRSVFAWYCKNLARSCSPEFNRIVLALLAEHDDKFEWPTAREIFEAFTVRDGKALDALNAF